MSSRFPEISEWTEATTLKTITVYKRMLRESGLFISGHFVVPQAPASFWCYFLRRKEIWFLEACLLNSDYRKKLLNDCK
ncbi:MAG: hypothetical protein IH594_14325 [Bacteroidales bacterium]|nr:hypothetical protein [Bacteroidales bacterium]